MVLFKAQTTPIKILKARWMKRQRACGRNFLGLDLKKRVQFPENAAGRLSGTYTAKLDGTEAAPMVLSLFWRNPGKIRCQKGTRSKGRVL
jgi:hypothetical protein